MFVTTFYSYKGGVGRTMALANVAALLADLGRKVLVVDFDLEAPGIPSYGPFTEASGKPGIVDYVGHYLDTNEVPDVSNYIVPCALNDGRKIWVLPAGDNTKHEYAEQFARIDWNRLYKERFGADLLEDMRAQWEEFDGKGFDYVLIDSRTGNTDISGICTRQLPDLVVLLFVPTRQNIVGLRSIVGLIRTEPERGGREIEIVFCPSNLPDVHDEDDVLGRALKAAQAELGYGDPAKLAPPEVTVGHWANMALLDLPVIALSREKSRLAQQYRELTTAIMSENREDRDGAKAALERLPEIFQAAREEKSSQVSSQIQERARQIMRRHPDDPELAFLAAEVFSEAQAYEEEERYLSIAIKSEPSGARQRLLRAVARINLDKKDAALEDLIEVFRSNQATTFDFVPAARLLKAVSKEPVAIARRVFDDPLSKPRAKIELSTYLMGRRDELDHVAESLVSVLDSGDLSDEFASDIINTASLALIGARRFDEAIALIERVLVEEPDNLASRFNRTIANWGKTGNIDKEDLEFLTEKLCGKSKIDGNGHQCAALVCAMSDDLDSAASQLREARDRSQFGHFLFSCWTYLYRTAEEFQSDLREMEAVLESGGQLRPPFLERR